MKRLLLVLTLFLASASSAFAQTTVYRVDPTPVMTTTGTPPYGGYPTAYFVPGATIKLCTTTACNVTATAYTDGTGVTACPSLSPVTLPGTNVCVPTAGTLGQFGFWVAPGNYYYTVTTSGGTFGPYPISSPSVSGTIGGTISSPHIPIATGPLTLGNSVITQTVSGGITEVSVPGANLLIPTDGLGVQFGVNESIYNDLSDTLINFNAKVGAGPATVAVLSGVGLDLPIGSLTVGTPTGGAPAAGSINISGQFLVNNVPVGGGSGEFNRSASGSLYYLTPINTGDGIYTSSNGATVTDLGQTGAIASSVGLYAMNGNTNTSVIGIINDGIAQLASSHTGSGTTEPIEIVFDGSPTAEFYKAGGMTLGTPTGANEGLGSLNAESLFVQGVPVSTSSGTAGQFTLIGSFLYPAASVNNAIINGATYVDSIPTYGSVAGMIIAVKPSGSAGGISVVSSNATAANTLTMTQSLSLSAITENFGTGGALVPWEFNMGFTTSIAIDTSGDVTINDGTTDLGYTLGVNGTLGVTGAITSTATSIAAISVAAGNGFALGSYVAMAESAGGLTLYTEVSGSRTSTVLVNAGGINIEQGGLTLTGATGGYQGVDTINAHAYYQDGVLLGGGLGGSGTSGTIPVFTGSVTVGNGPLSVSGSTVTVTDALTTTGALIAPSFTTAGPIVSTDSGTAITVAAGNGMAIGSYEAISGDADDTSLAFAMNDSSSRVINGNWAYNKFVMGGANPSSDFNAAAHPAMVVVADAAVGQFTVVSAAANASTMSLQISNSTGTANIVSGRSTTGGTYLPMEFYTGGSEQLEISTAGDIYMPNIPSASPGDYVCFYPPNGLLSYSTACTDKDAKVIADMQSQIDALTQRLDALTNQAVATKKEQQ